MKILRAEFDDGRAMTAKQAAEVVGLTLRNTRPYLALLHDQRAIRIAGWRCSGCGPWSPMYRKRHEDDDEPDAPRPGKVERLARLRVKRQMKKGAMGIGAHL